MATNKYANGKIYRLVNDVDDELYIGSTCLPLHKRLYNHKMEARGEKPKTVHKHLNQIGWDTVKIVLVELYPCNNKMELERQERKWIDELKPSLNKRIPTRTTAEYRNDNKVVIAQKKKEEYEKNKEYYLSYQQTYRESNREELNNKQKEKYARKREEYLEKKKEVVECACGCEIVGKDHLQRHMRTKKHKLRMMSLSNQGNLQVHEGQPLSSS